MDSPDQRLAASEVRLRAGRNLEALEIARQLVLDEPPDPVCARALWVMGVAETLTGGAERALGPLERARVLHEGDPEMLADDTRFIAYTLELLGVWEDAIARYHDAAKWYGQVGNAGGQGQCLSGAGSCLSVLGRRDEAEAAFREALGLLAVSDKSHVRATVLGALAEQIVDRAPVEAMALFDEADTIDVAWAPARADLDARRARVHLIIGELDKAEDRARRALENAEPRSAPAAGARLCLAAIALHRDDPMSALRELALGEAVNDFDRGERQAVLAEAKVQSGDFDISPHLDRLAVLAPSSSPFIWSSLQQIADQMEDPTLAARTLCLALRHGHRNPSDASVELVDLRRRGAEIPLTHIGLIAPIGRGGMGQVWRGIHRETRQEVAVKILPLQEGAPPHLRTLFDAEVRAIARLDHPGIVGVLAAGELDRGAAAMVGVDPGSPTLMMELATGGTLGSHSAGWSWEELRSILGHLLDALGHAHAREVLHLDLKPSNVLLSDVDGELRPVLTDFGLAGLRAIGESRIMGTPQYMAPEQFRGDPLLLGPWTDLYALGCLAWRLVTGELPFEATTVPQWRDAHATAQLPPLRPEIAVGDEFDAWLHGLLAKSPEDRFRCAADAAWALARMGDATTLAADFTPSVGILAAETIALDGGTFGFATTAAPERAVRPMPVPSPQMWKGVRETSLLPFLPGAGVSLFGMRIPRLVAREAEQEALWGALMEVRSSRTCTAMGLFGPRGSGRSRLVRWLAERARGSGAANVVEATQSDLGDIDALVARVGLGVRERPVLVVADGVPATEIFGAIETKYADEPVLVLVAAQRIHPRFKHAHWLELSPLSDVEIRTVLDGLLPLDERLSVALSSRARGNATFGVALLTDLVARDALEAGPGGYTLRPHADAGLPDELHDLTLHRLDKVALPGSGVRNIWECGAILGATPDLGEWKTACEAMQIGDLQPPLQILIRRRWATVGGGVARFVPAVHEALERAATESGRHVRIHRTLADLIEVSGVDLARLGHHLASAGRFEEALEPLQQGARNLVNAGRVRECLVAIERWHEVADAAGYSSDHPERAKLFRVRASLSYHIGEDALVHQERALALVAGIDTREEVRVRYALGHEHRRRDQFALAKQRFEEALALDPDGLLRGLCILGLAEVAFDAGGDGRDQVETAREIFSEFSPDLMARCDIVLGRGLSSLGEYDDAVIALERGKEGSRDAGWMPVVAQACNDLAHVAIRRGDLAGGDAYFGEAISVYRELGSARWVEVTVIFAEEQLGRGRVAETRAMMSPVLRRHLHELKPRMVERARAIQAQLAASE